MEDAPADEAPSRRSVPVADRSSTLDPAERTSALTLPNPFPGPQPYRAADRERFHGREELSYRLEASVLANRCVTVYGPSGAGKSSLMQASVIPALIDAQRVRVVRMDAWPEDKEPTQWLADAVYSALSFGARPAELSAEEALLSAAQRAARKSPRIALLYLDQIEQLLYPSRSTTEVEAFFAALNQLVDTPLRGLRVVLLLREDYLGRFRDRLREHRRLLSHGFRVGPLTVAELSEAVCKAAAGGQPSQTWQLAPVRALMLQVRMPGQAESDDAEAQAAYAQIVCRALFQQWAQGGGAAEQEVVEAEPILRRYLEATLDDLGALSAAARRLLEDHLITADGSRTLRTEKELLRLLPAEELGPILKALERAAILYAEEHQGSRYFEIGHDWLARRVSEARQQRELEDEQRHCEETQRRREEEQERELARERSEAAMRLARARAQRRTFGIIAAASLVFAAVTVALAYKAKRAQDAAEEAQQKAFKARVEAVRKRIEANDQRILAGYLALTSRGDAAWAMKLLPEVKYPAELLGWLSYASDALSTNALHVTLRGHAGSLSAAVFSPDGKRVLIASHDGTARVWSADGTGKPIELKGHTEAITSATFSPDGQRVLTTSEDGTARVWSAGGKGDPVVLTGSSGRKLMSGAFSPDGKRVVTGGEDAVARIFDADGGGRPIELSGSGGHTGAIRYVTFFPDGLRVATASDDKTARVWTLNPKEPPLVLRGQLGPVRFLAVSGDGTRIVTASQEATAHIFVLEGKTARPLPALKGHHGEVSHVAISPDGRLVATACGDRLARIFAIDAMDQPPILLDGHRAGVTYVAFRPDGRFLATASLDGTGRIHPVNGGTMPLVLQGHSGSVDSVAWSPDGSRLLTAAQDERRADYSAKIWSANGLKSLRRGGREADSFHTVSLSPDGALLVATYDDNTARLRRVDEEGDPVRFAGHAKWVANAALSPTGDRVVTAAFDRTARVWSADGKGAPVELLGHTGDVHAAAFSPDGMRVVTAAEDRTARVWNARGGAPLATLSGHEDWLTSAAFSPDGMRVVTASHDHTARVFRADGSGSPVVLAGHRGAVVSAVFDGEGKRIVTASEDGTVRVWSADGAGAPIVLQGRGTGTLLRAVFSGDGKRVAASSTDGLIYVWSAEDQSHPIVLKAEQPALALAFLDRDQTLLAILADNTAHRWTVDVKTLEERLKSAHADCLPVDVRTQYLDETVQCAINAFERCESGYHRRPAPPQIPGCDGDLDLALLAETSSAPRAPGPPALSGTGNGQSLRWVKNLGPDGRHVKVIVLPGDAEVTIAGVSTMRRDGAIELVGRKGDVVKLRVSKAGRYLEQDVKIQEEGAFPSLLDLSPRIVEKAGKAKMRLKPGEADYRALLSRENE
ncbi:AAA family ATPase [Sorangium cellulosum]|uniref:nSTAND1 domain-containing NTPase n=1 Tax=Sorangium cellulosum TaxID=56 RepID=UPI003D9AB461